MKKILILSALVAGALFSNAQSVSDGLLYTGEDLKGTARYRALSGAFGALGGDLSAIGANPASSVVFANNYAGVSLGFMGSDNSSNYFGTNTVANENDFNINQAGGVLVFKSPENKAISKFSLAINYDLTRNFDNAIRVIGTSPISVSQYFLNNANGIALDNFTVRTGEGETASDLYRFLGQDIGFGAQQGFLGYESFLLDAADPNNLAGTTYLSNTGTGAFNQDYLLQTAGYSSKVSFNGALELNNKWNLGVNLNSHIISTERFTSIEERNSNTDATVSNVRFDNTLFTDANGFSFQLGLIGKLTESFRIGATYESPTWYSIDESQIQEISTRAPGNASIVRVRPNVVNVFAPYRLRSPGSLTGSLAYVFGKSGLLSLDYSITDHRQLRFRPENSAIFRDNNRFINDNLQTASSLRIGGEYRIERWTLRGGYRFEESPYENTEIMGNLNGYSFGLGYTWGKTVLDISYDRAERDFSQQLFDTGLNTTAGVMNTMDNIILTVGFNL